MKKTSTSTSIAIAGCMMISLSSTSHAKTVITAQPSEFMVQQALGYDTVKDTKLLTALLQQTKEQLKKELPLFITEIQYFNQKLTAEEKNAILTESAKLPEILMTKWLEDYKKSFDNLSKTATFDKNISPEDAVDQVFDIIEKLSKETQNNQLLSPENTKLLESTAKIYASEYVKNVKPELITDFLDLAFNNIRVSAIVEKQKKATTNMFRKSLNFDDLKYLQNINEQKISQDIDVKTPSVILLMTEKLIDSIFHDHSKLHQQFDTVMNAEKLGIMKQITNTVCQELVMSYVKDSLKQAFDSAMNSSKLKKNLKSKINKINSIEDKETQIKVMDKVMNRLERLMSQSIEDLLKTNTFKDVAVVANFAFSTPELNHILQQFQDKKRNDIVKKIYKSQFNEVLKNLEESDKKRKTKSTKSTTSNKIKQKNKKETDEILKFVEEIFDVPHATKDFENFMQKHEGFFKENNFSLDKPLVK